MPRGKAPVRPPSDPYGPPGFRAPFGADVMARLPRIELVNDVEGLREQLNAAARRWHTESWMQASPDADKVARELHALRRKLETARAAINGLSDGAVWVLDEQFRRHWNRISSVSRIENEMWLLWSATQDPQPLRHLRDQPKNRRADSAGDELIAKLIDLFEKHAGRPLVYYLDNGPVDKDGGAFVREAYDVITGKELAPSRLAAFSRRRVA